MQLTLPVTAKPDGKVLGARRLIVPVALTVTTEVTATSSLLHQSARVAMLAGREPLVKNRASTVCRNQWIQAFAFVRKVGPVMDATLNAPATVNETLTDPALAPTQKGSEGTFAK